MKQENITLLVIVLAVALTHYGVEAGIAGVVDYGGIHRPPVPPVPHCRDGEVYNPDTCLC